MAQKFSRKINRLLASTESFRAQLQYLFLFIALFASLSVLLWNVSATISRGYRERAKFEEISQDVEDTQSEVDALKGELAYAQSERSAEEGARNVLGYILPGEQVVFVDESRLPDDEEDAVAEEDDEMVLASGETFSSNLEGWMKLFFY